LKNKDFYYFSIVFLGFKPQSISLNFTVFHAIMDTIWTPAFERSIIKRKQQLNFTE